MSRLFNKALVDLELKVEKIEKRLDEAVQRITALEQQKREVEPCQKLP